MRWLTTRLGGASFDAATDAFFWFHLRRMAFWLPVMAVIMWLIALLLASMDGEQRWSWAFDLYPFYCLCAAAFLCGVRFSGAWLVGKDRKSLTPLCPSATTRQAVNARLLADGIALFGTRCVVSLVYFIWLFTADDKLLFSMATRGLAYGYTDLREVISWVVGVPLIGGAAAWACMGFAYRPVRRFTVFVIVAALLESIMRDVLSYDNRHFGIPPEYDIWVLFGLVIVFLVGATLLGLRRKAIGIRTVMYSCAVWCGLILAAYPFGPRIAEGKVLDAQTLLVCTAVSSALVLPYQAASLDIKRRRRRIGIWTETDCSSADSSAIPPRIRRVAWRGLVCVVVFIAWLRWPADPAVWKMWRSQGLPATPRDLNSTYPSVPDEENLALKCLQIHSQYTEGLRKWVDSLSGVEQSNRDPGYPLADVPLKIREEMFGVGWAAVKRNEPIAPEVVRQTREFWRAVGEETAEKLHALATSGLTKSRYPIDLSEGLETKLPHLGEIRSLVRVLDTAALLAAIDDEPNEVVDAFCDSIKIINSLQDEPIFISQYIRLQLVGTSITTIETAMAHSCVSEETLRRLQEGIAGALSPLRDGYLMDKTIQGDLVMYIDSLRNPVRLRSEVRGGTVSPEDPMTWLCDVLGQGKLDQLAFVWTASRLRAWSREAGLGRQADLVSLKKAGWPFEHVEPCFICEKESDRPAGPQLSWRLSFATMVLTGWTISYEMECDFRTRLNVARVALGVERFRLANGAFPQKLDEIVPDYIDSIPEDPWNPRHGLSSRVRENGDFVVYGFGRDGEDNGGTEREPGGGWYHTDNTFTVSAQKVVDDPD